MKFNKDKYRSKIKNIVEDANVEAENVNWKIVFITTAVVSSILFFGIGFANNIIDYNRVLAEQNAILEDIKSIEKEIEDLKLLQEEVEMLTFVEKQAREKLKMVRTDEIVYIDLSE